MKGKGMRYGDDKRARKVRRKKQIS